MEINSTIAKTFKRFTIPRSTSSMGSFTTSNGTANSMESNSQESSSHHKHPPLSYAQHYRPVQQHYSQQNLNTSASRQQYQTPTRPSSEDASSYMVRSASIDFHPSTNGYTSKKSKMNKNSSITHDISFDDIKDLPLDSTNDKTIKINGHKRSSIKSMLLKKFQPLSSSTSINITAKQKKPHSSFRQFSRFLKRSHSANSDLSTISPTNNQLTTDPVDHSLQIQPSNESDSTYATRLHTNSTSLVPISEEENPIQQNRSKTMYNYVDDSNPNQSDNAPSAYIHVPKITPSLSVSSTSSLSGTSSTSNKYPSSTQQRDDLVKPSKSSSSMTSNTGTALSVLTNNKPYLTNSISLHGDVNHLMNNPHLSVSNANNSKERTVVHQTMSLTADIENSQVTKVKMRDHTAKKKKGLRDLKARISLPPEVKNGFIQRTNHQATESSNIRSKLAQRSSYYQTTSSSVNGLADVLNQSHASLSHLSPQLNSSIASGPLSRNEHRRSMLDLGFGKIESYVKLEKLGEGTYATVYKGTSNLVSGFIALKEIRLEQEEGAPCTALREVSLLKDLKHNNIVSLYDIIFNPTTLTLVFEYVPKDLKQYMDDCGNILHMKNVRLFLFQLLRGLDYCHSKKILHRDLKPQNLLINEHGELKLADFGLARIKSFPTKTYSHEVVTLWYRPPDVLLGSTEYSTPIDIWAVGCIFYEMACGKPLFPGTKVEEELYLIFKYLGTPTEQTLPGVTSNPDFQELKLPFYYADLLNRLAPRLDQIGLNLLETFLRYNPHSRISARDAMMHKFFSCYPSEIHSLGPLQSILDLNEISLTKDHGSKLVTSSLMKTAISKRSSVHL